MVLRHQSKDVQYMFYIYNHFSILLLFVPNLLYLVYHTSRKGEKDRGRERDRER